VVEGKHAANAVKRVRDRRQAIVAMQGKVPNINRSGKSKAGKSNPHLQLLSSLLDSDCRGSQFARVLILTDPDADGVHEAMLLISYLSLSYPQIIEAGRLDLVRVPLFLINRPSTAMRMVYSKAQLAQLQGEYGGSLEASRIKGVASLPPPVLLEACVDRTSRVTQRMTPATCASIADRLC